MIPLRGKTALITGGSRGIGLAIAQHFARLGASTILVGRSAERLDRAVQSVREQPAGIQTQADSPPFHVSAEGDVACPETWASLVAKLSAGGFGQRLTAEDGSPDRVDVLVNCAGVSQNSLLVRAGIDEIQEILDVNLKSAVLGCKFIGKHMMRAGRTLRAGTSAIAGDGPSIINVSSVMATRGGAGAAVYAATKAGLLGLTSAQATELGQHGIRVNALVPGFIETAMTKNFSREFLSQHIPLRRIGRAEEVADAAAFLAQNPYVSNCHLRIDGGLTGAFFSPK